MAVCFFSFFLISRRSSLWSIREKTSLDPKCRNFLSKFETQISFFDLSFPFSKKRAHITSSFLFLFLLVPNLVLKRKDVAV